MSRRRPPNTHSTVHSRIHGRARHTNRPLSAGDGAGGRPLKLVLLSWIVLSFRASMHPPARLFTADNYHHLLPSHHDEPLTFDHTSSATAAHIQADVFSSRRITAGSLLHMRIFCALWMTVGVLLVPVCEFTGGSCALGVSRGDSSLPGERGNLVGEGQPLPDPSATPLGPHARTLWTMASLSYVLSLALLAYLLVLLLLSFRHRMLLKQCASYSYSSLSIVSHSSTAAHPLTLGMKFAALLFQIVIPSTIGVSSLMRTASLPQTPLLQTRSLCVLNRAFEFVCFALFLFRWLPSTLAASCPIANRSRGPSRSTCTWPRRSSRHRSWSVHHTSAKAMRERGWMRMAGLTSQLCLCAFICLFCMTAALLPLPLPSESAGILVHGCAAVHSSAAGCVSVR